MASGPGENQHGHIQEPVHGHGQREESTDAAAAATSTGAPSAAAGAEGRADVSSSPPPPAPPVERLQERAREQPGGGGTEGSSSAAAGVDRKGKKVAFASPPPTPSPTSSAGSSPSTTFAADATTSVAGTSSSAADNGKGVTWGDPTETVVVPLRRRFDNKQVFEQLLQKGRAAMEDAGRRWDEAEEKKKQEEEQARSLQAKKTLWTKVKDHLKNKDRPPQVKVALSPEKTLLWSKVKEHLKNLKFLDIKGRKIWYSKRNSIGRPQVHHQTIPMIGVIKYYFDQLYVAQSKLVAENVVGSLYESYLEFRPVDGDGECFYRSFIFSYLEQVLDRQDTHEENRLLAAVETVAMQHADLGWTSEFSRSHKAFTKLIEKVMRWKRRLWDNVASTNSYRKKKLIKFFSSYDTTKDIFVFLRLAAAIWICSHRQLYEPHIPELTEDYSLKDHVTPARELTDHVQMAAMANALKVPLRVEQLLGREPQPQDIYSGDGNVRVTLLYTGNHYDIIYPKPPSGESSSQQAFQGQNPPDQSSDP